MVLCLRWYLRYSLSYRDLEEMMAERGLSLDHSTIARWVLRYAPILSRRIRCEMRRPNRSWRVDENCPACYARRAMGKHSGREANSADTTGRKR